MSNEFELPPPVPGQAYLDVSLLEAGFLAASESLFVEGGLPENVFRCPSMSFILHHSENGKIIIFDLGIRKDWENYPPSVVRNIKKNFPCEVPDDVVDSLRKGGLEPSDIDFAIPSHVHWDHVGNPDLFPTTHFFTGEKTRDVLAGGCSHDENDPEFQTGYFWKDTLPEDRTTYLSGVKWTKLGPFTKAYDFFNDGSMYIIDAPGHLPGHINLLARTSPDGSWIYLGGDSAHDVRLITGEKEIAHFHNPATGKLMCMHGDLTAAKETIRRIRVISQNPRVLVLIAHDHAWYNVNKDTGVIFPGKLKPRI